VENLSGKGYFWMMPRKTAEKRVEMMAEGCWLMDKEPYDSLCKWYNEESAAIPKVS